MKGALLFSVYGMYMNIHAHTYMYFMKHGACMRIRTRTHTYSHTVTLLAYLGNQSFTPSLAVSISIYLR